MKLSGVSANEVKAAAVVPPPAERTAVTVLEDAAYRALDIVVAAVMLLLLSPLLAAIALAIRIDSPGPALFRQTRMGRRLRPFTVVKFRTMHDGVSTDVHRAYMLGLINGTAKAHAGEDGPKFKLHADPRVTRLGGLLRSTSLDELPQLWNVLRGEMSLVGPRPAIGYEVDHYQARWYGRFAVKPGVTGLWQVSGRCELTVPEMIELDLEYVRRRSLALNVWILLKTIPVVLSRRGAS